MLGNASTGGKTVTFTTAAAIDHYLPAGGKEGVFTVSAINPTKTSAGVFGGQLLTALLNVQFSTDFDALGELRFTANCSAICASLQGKTLFEVIYIAQQVIANQPSITYWNAYTPRCLSNALEYFNRAFEKCQNVVNGECFSCAPFQEMEPLSDSVAQDGPVSPDNAPWLSGTLFAFIALMAFVVLIVFLVSRFRRTRARNDNRLY